jgi:thioredoxin-related protein
MRFTVPAALVALLAIAILPAAGGDPPAKDKPLFNEKADAKADVQAAVQKAAKDNRRVLIEWGSNGSDASVLLRRKLIKETELSRKLLYEYVVVTVDVGKVDRNLDLAKHYQAALTDGIPYLTVLAGDGKVLANQAAAAFETKADGQKDFDSKKLLDFLAKYEATPLVAEKVLQAGLEQAAKADRLVFLHFGAPWCGWCHKLEGWMAQPEVKAVLDKEFIDVMIDTDRMEGGKDLFKRFNPAGKGGIPWFAFVDAKGKALATSDGPKGNIGHPWAEDEIEYFVKMLQTTRRHLSAQDIEAVEKSLKAQKK